MSAGVGTSDNFVLFPAPLTFFGEPLEDHPCQSASDFGATSSPPEERPQPRVHRSFRSTSFSKSGSSASEQMPKQKKSKGPSPPAAKRRVRSQSWGHTMTLPPPSPTSRRSLLSVDSSASKNAQKTNDSMVYLEGPQVYTCAHCRTHLTSHDDIISKSFHGRQGRAYLFDQCVNVSTGRPEERRLITGLHTVCDIFCKRCHTLIGWTYQRAYEASQKYKEGKFIVEKINLHLEESHFGISKPAGERPDRWRQRSMSWGSQDDTSTMVYEYQD